MNKMMLPLVLCVLLCPGLCSSTFTANGTSYYNITGTIYKYLENAQEILDRESDVFKDIAGNLTRGFGTFFPQNLRWLEYTVTVMETFLWPTFEGEYTKVYNLSFALIVQNKFQTTPEKKDQAEKFVISVLWYSYAMKVEKDEHGYFISEGLRIRYENANLLPTPMINNVTNDYMAFIAKKSGDVGNNGGDDKPHKKTSTGNSSAQESFNSTEKTKSVDTAREISYIAYVGISLSVIGLLITMMSICYFRRLRKFRRNQILVHICATVMAGMLLSIISFTHKGHKHYCTALAIMLHYFILAALSWMCVEAYNLYRDLVKVFNTNVVSNREFILRACLFGYGLPALIVSITSIADISVYGQRNDACWMTSLAFLVSFLAPVLLIVSINIVFFNLIMREIIQATQRDPNNIRASLRAAISLSVVLGFCWLLAGISTFTTNQFVTYAFVIMSSFQGLFIFLFHGIGKKELRDSWKSLPIFNLHFKKFSNDSQGRGKTESTTQDIQQVSKRFSTVDEAGKLSKDFDPGLQVACDAGYQSACETDYTQAYSQESGLDINEGVSITGVPDEKRHESLKMTANNC